jgi:hypothetical protein
VALRPHLAVGLPFSFVALLSPRSRARKTKEYKIIYRNTNELSGPGIRGRLRLPDFVLVALSILRRRLVAREGELGRPYPQRSSEYLARRGVSAVLEVGAGRRLVPKSCIRCTHRSSRRLYLTLGHLWSKVSSRSREGFRRPSDREDIVYRDRGQLGLP